MYKKKNFDEYCINTKAMETTILKYLQMNRSRSLITGDVMRRLWVRNRLEGTDCQKLLTLILTLSLAGGCDCQVWRAFV